MNNQDKAKGPKDTQQKSVLQRLSEVYDEDDEVSNHDDRRERYIPKLDRALDGGPQNFELLLSYEAHVAHYIWGVREMKQEREPLKFHQRSSQIKMWIPTSLRVEQMVQKTGLGHLRACMHEHIDSPLLSAFVERWQPETNSFHMPWGEMTITLHDIWKILHLRIDGDAVVLEKSKGRQKEIKELAQALGIDYSKLSTEMKKGSIKYKTLVEAGKNTRDGNTTLVAYLMHLLSTTVFVDKSPDRAQDRLFLLVRDLPKVSNYAWGAAVLALLYRKLGEASRLECKQMSGCATLLQSWIYEYFPLFRPQRDFRYRSHQPRAMRWMTSAKPDQSKKALLNYRIALDRMTLQQVEWMPYGPLDFETTHLRVSCYHGPISCMRISEPYMPDRVARQFGRVQNIPGQVICPERAHRHADPSRYSVTYPNAEWAWGRRHTNHTISLNQMGDPVLASFDCAHDYMRWYYPRTRQFMCHPRHEFMADYPRPGPGGDYIGTERINQVVPTLRKLIDPMREDVPHEYWQQVLMSLEHLTRYPRFPDEPPCSTFELGNSSVIEQDEDDEDMSWSENEDEDDSGGDGDDDDSGNDPEDGDNDDDDSRDDYEDDDSENEDDDVNGEDDQV